MVLLTTFARFSKWMTSEAVDCGKTPHLPASWHQGKFGPLRLRSAGAMHRPQLEHIIRAAAAITGACEFVIIGSQAVLGQFPDAPADLLVSIEADVFTLRNPADADLIDGSIGEGSPFHQTFGYYAHGVSADTAVLPAGWRDRLVPVQNLNTGGGTGLCLEVHDLAVSKLVAGREKDIEFVGALFHHKLARVEIIRVRLDLTTLSDSLRKICFERIKRLGGS
jgi:hypothetical protein